MSLGRTISFTSIVADWESRLKEVPLPVEHMMSNWERKVLGAFALSLTENKLLFEFGTWEGRTAAWLAKLIPQSTLYTIDLPSDASGMHPEQQKECLTYDAIGSDWKAGRLQNVNQLYGDSKELEFIVPSEFTWGKFDLVLVDGNHRYEYVKSDSEIAGRIIRPGGCIILHDFNPTWEQTREEVIEGPFRFVMNDSHEWTHIENTAFVYRIA